MTTHEIFRKAAIAEARFEQIMRDFGYERKTTFYSDLTLAEPFGRKGITDTYDSVVKNWLGDHEYFTEFVLCLNHKIWEHYETDENLARIYDELWTKAADTYLEHYKDDREALDYYFRVTD